MTIFVYYFRHVYLLINSCVTYKINVNVYDKDNDGNGDKDND